MVIQGQLNDKEFQIIEHNFEVKDSQSIHINFISGPFEHIVVNLRNPLKEIKAQFTFKTRLYKYCLTDNFDTCSNYCSPTQIMDGTWTLEIIKSSTIFDSYEIEIYTEDEVNQVQGLEILAQDRSVVSNKEERWYQGDLHFHSNYSDGRYDLDSIMKVAKDKGMDYLAVTEHNTLTTKVEPVKFPIIPATEITWDNDGHYNAYGLDTYINYREFIDLDKDKNFNIDTMFKELSKRGILLSINHPFTKTKGVNHDFDVRSFRLLEVINAPHLISKEIDNEKAVKFFDYLWNHGHYLWAVGGSDSHKENYNDTYPLGLPTTKLWSSGLSIEKLLHAMQTGNSYIENELKFEISMEQGLTSILPGTRVQGEVNVHASCQQEVEWLLIKSGDIIDRKVGRTYSNKVQVEKNEFYRIEARYNNEIKLFINPIHDMVREATVHSMQELIKGFESNYRK